MVATGKIGAANGAVKQRVACKNQIFCREKQRNAARGMPWGGQNLAGHTAKTGVAHGNGLGRVGGYRGESPQAALGGFGVCKAVVVGADINGSSCCLL